MMKLSKRLTTIYDLIPNDAILADIGTDHGLLIVYALENKKINKAYAMDIAKQPLDSARENMTRFGYESMVSFQLRNGLQGFEGDANCFVIAGMGAETIWEIMDAYTFKSDDTIIVQSNTKLPWLRETLMKEGFEITEERFFIDRDIPTFIMVLKLSEKPIKATQTDIWVGPVLQTQNNPEHTMYLKQRLEHIQKFVDVNPVHQDEINALMNYL